MKRVLIVSYFFPPSQAIGALRVSKFAKYLADYGWEARVLTAAPELLSFTQSLNVEIPEAQIVRVRYWDPLTKMERQVVQERYQRSATAGATTAPGRRKLLSLRSLIRPLWRLFPINQVRFPDRSMPWYLPALRSGREVLRAWQPDALFSSAGPPGSHIIASLLSRHSGLPWVADYRDLWSHNHSVVYPRWIDSLERTIERKIVAPASALVTVSNPLADYLRDAHQKPVEVIMNGFDERDFEHAVPLTTPFTITYTGSANPPVSDPSALFAATAQLHHDNTICPGAFLIRFYGNISPKVQAIAEQHGISDYVRVNGAVPHQESVRHQMESSVLLLLTWSGEQRQGGVLTGKVFEYLGAGRPILAVGAQDASVSALLNRTRAGLWSNAVDAIAAQLREWIYQHQQKGRIDFASNEQHIRSLTRRVQSQQLAALLNRVTAPPA